MPSARSADGLPGQAAEILREITDIAAEPGTLPERAEALFAHVLRVGRFDAGWITLLPPGQDTHVSLVRSGYDDRTHGYLDGTSLLEDVELLGLRQSRRPIRLQDMPMPPSEFPAWAEYLEPAGFREGVSAGLFTPEGRYLGVLSLHTQATDQVSEATRDLVGLLATPIASAVDPLRSASTVAGIVQQATAGVVLAPSGAVLPLPGLPDHRLLTRGSEVLAAAAAQLAESGPYASFLALLPEPEGGTSHVRITVLTVPRDLRVFAAAVVVLSPAGNLHGLSQRELQVLGLLVTGASNERIAAALGITARTVEVHIDHVRTKLAASSRTAAAARALRRGLFVPSPSLVDHGPPAHTLPRAGAQNPSLAPR
jgi:DNA-binding CsgD family transcriptional regulator